MMASNGSAVPSSKRTCSPASSRDVRLDRDVAAAGADQKLARHGGMRLPEPLLGPRQAVVFHPAHGQADQQRPEHPLRQQRQPGLGAHQGVDRPAIEILGNDVRPAPRGEHQPRGHAAVAQLAGDVHGAIADAHDQHPLAVQVVRREGVDILMRVKLNAVEVARKRRLGPAGVPVVAVGRRSAGRNAWVSPLSSRERQVPSASRSARSTPVLKRIESQTPNCSA